MAEKKTANKQNTVRLVGYLRENNLEKVINSRGDDVIRGSILVATDELSSHKVQFYVAAKTKTGDDSKDYETLSALLPENTVTVASYLKDHPGADYKAAAAEATKVWVLARLEEYASCVGEKVRSLVTIKGFRAGVKEPTETSPYKPCAEFTADVYIKEMKNEVVYADENDEDGTETGRILITGLMPMYDKSMQQIEFVCPKEDGVADYISNHYAVSDTVTLKGDLISIAERVLISDNSDDFFGNVNTGPQYETKFTRERRVLGGSKTPIKQGAEGSITTKEVKDGLAARQVKMEKNGERSQASQAEPKEDTSKKGFSDPGSFSADLDF